MKARELVGRLKQLGRNGWEIPTEAAAMLERFLALADELEADSKSSLWTDSEQAIFAQISERLNEIGRSS